MNPQEAIYVLQGIDIEKEFLNRTPFTQELRPAVGNWDPIKPKSIRTTKQTSI